MRLRGAGTYMRTTLVALFLELVDFDHEVGVLLGDLLDHSEQLLLAGELGPPQEHGNALFVNSEVGERVFQVLGEVEVLQLERRYSGESAGDG